MGRAGESDVNTGQNHIRVAMFAALNDGVERPMGKFDDFAVEDQRFRCYQSVNASDRVMHVM